VTTDRLEAALYLVATPIGNLEDLSPRAARILALADVVGCEDTRHSGPLLVQVGARGRRVAVHDHNEDTLAAQLVDDVLAGRSVALISDAGTPLISDPGFPVVQEAVKRGARVVAIPGPSAALAALCVSGLSSARFYFAGFLPERASRRDALLEELRELFCSLIFYAPARDLPDTLRLLAAGLGDRRAAVCRELTKLHEEVRRGPLLELAAAEMVLKGEAVVVVDGAQETVASAEDLDAAIHAALGAGESPSSAAKRLARQLNLARKTVYERVMQLKGG